MRNTLAMPEYLMINMQLYKANSCHSNELCVTLYCVSCSVLCPTVFCFILFYVSYCVVCHIVLCHFVLCVILCCVSYCDVFHIVMFGILCCAPYCVVCHIVLCVILCCVSYCVVLSQRYLSNNCYRACAVICLTAGYNICYQNICQLILKQHQVWVFPVEYPGLKL